MPQGRQNDNLPGSHQYKISHHAQQSPIMPGNGNSQMNYQQRKSLKKTSSNEQYKVTNQQYKNASRGGSMNSS